MLAALTRTISTVREQLEILLRIQQCNGSEEIELVFFFPKIFLLKIIIQEKKEKFW